FGTRRQRQMCIRDRTGIVFNDTGGFELGAGNPARFLFATEDGTISGWSPGVDPTRAILMVDNSAADAVYKGLALASRAGNPTLYAADFHNGRIDAFDTNFDPVLLPGTFADPNLPAGFAPFNIHAIGGVLIVTFAVADADGHDDVPGPGNGLVDVFDLDGGLMQRLITQGQLNSPWGLARAPADFGQFSNDLLVGNFGDGRINAFDPGTGAFHGTLADSLGADLVTEGLWGLIFGNGGNGGATNTLYVTAGISGGGEVEDHGLFAKIESIEEPTPVMLASFEASSEEDGVLLTWSMYSDIGPLAFDVYRSHDGAPAQRINPVPVEPDGGVYRYLDHDVEAGTGYSYEIEIVQPSGAGERFGPVAVQARGPAATLWLRANPSLTSGEAMVSFSLPQSGPVRIGAFDVSGREVRTITNVSYPSGMHQTVWDGRDDFGRKLPAGTYYLKLASPTGLRTSRVTMTR
ncbi:MAG: TIGR03118 family protein, partial [Candidatus Eisenbacteria bacterium]|nr:TIGR03118 family protein [Candidatus Eisenbacteria bacterium]